MDDEAGLFEKIEGLTDLEIAILLCLIAEGHCIVDTDNYALDDLLVELRLIVGDVFGLTYTILECSSATTVEDLRRSMFVRENVSRIEADKASVFSGTTNASSDVLRAPNQRRRSTLSQPQLLRDRNSPDLVNVVIAKHFNLASEDVQVAMLDAIRSKTIRTRTGPRALPKPFVFIPLVATNPRGLARSFNKHLLDHIFSSYHHQPENGFPNVEDDFGWFANDQASNSSVVRQPASTLVRLNRQRGVLFRDEDISTLRAYSQGVSITPDLMSYVYSIAVFLRMHRGVAAGISPSSTSHVIQFARCLAPLQKVDYVFPALVDIAARQVYRHRILIGTPSDDRSLLYGSSLRAAEMVFADLSPEKVIEETLDEVEAPV